MAYPDLRSTARVAGHPLHPLLVPIPIACFVGTLVTDIVYWRTADIFSADMSAWLVSVGVVFAILAALAGLIDFASSPAIRAQRPAWLHAIGDTAWRVSAASP